MPVTLERRRTGAGGGYAVVTVDNPPLNLYDEAVFAGLAAAVAELTADPPRAVLLRAAGKVVSAGVDVHQFDGLIPQQGSDLWDRLFREIMHPIEELPCPVVAAVHGLTLTAAFEIALTADLIVASRRARFGLVETVVGLTPSMGGPARLAAKAGANRAAELIMTGDLYSAETMREWGVVNVVAEDVDAAATALVERLADGPTRAHAATKAIIRRQREAGVRAADALTLEVSGALFATDDLRGAVRAFLADNRGGHPYQGS